jgi:hypothetical protein
MEEEGMIIEEAVREDRMVRCKIHWAVKIFAEQIMEEYKNKTGRVSFAKKQNIRIKNE